MNFADKYFNFDFINGIPKGLIILNGRCGCGKTTWAVQTASNIVRNYHNASVYHYDMEYTSSKDRIKLLTGFSDEDMSKKYHLICNSIITPSKLYKKLHLIGDIKLSNRWKYEYDTGRYDDTGNKVYAFAPTVFIIDSLSHMPLDEMSLSEVIRRCIPMMGEMNIVIFLINHINLPIQKNIFISGECIGYGSNENLRLMELANTALIFSHISKTKYDRNFGIDYNLIGIHIVKSRLYHKRIMYTLILSNNGFEQELSYLKEIIDSCKVHESEDGVYIGNRSDITFSYINFKQKLEEIPELYQIFVDELTETAKYW